MESELRRSGVRWTSCYVEPLVHLSENARHGVELTFEAGHCGKDSSINR